MPKSSAFRRALQDFDITKYQGVHNLTPIGWVNALVERAMDLDSLLLGRNVFDEESGWEDRILQKYSEAPCDFVKLNRRKRVDPTPDVYDATLNDVFEMNRLLENTTDFKEMYVHHHERHMDGLEKHHYVQQEEELETSCDLALANARGMVDVCQALVSVNLTSPDELILASFKSWLGKRRKYLQENAGDFEIEQKPFSQKQFDKWERLELLGFIDLVIIANRYDSKISNHRIGALLFPDEYDTDTGERVRKVIAPEVKFVLQDTTLMALEALAHNFNAE